MFRISLLLTLPACEPSLVNRTIVCTIFLGFKLSSICLIMALMHKSKGIWQLKCDRKEAAICSRAHNYAVILGIQWGHLNTFSVDMGLLCHNPDFWLYNPFFTFLLNRRHDLKHLEWKCIHYLRLL